MIERDEGRRAASSETEPSPAPARDRNYISPIGSEVAATSRRRVRLAIGLAAIALAVLSLLAWRGGSYYALDPEGRLAHPENRTLRPSGSWGHGVGIAATLVMMLNFLYPLRKRARWMNSLGSVPTWLVFHITFGLLTPAVILFHAAFRLHNLIATFTYGSLLVVVVTGLIGRYIYSLAPGAGGHRSAEIVELRQAWFEAQARAREIIGAGAPPSWFVPMLEPPGVARTASPVAALIEALRWPASAARARVGARALARRLSPEAGREIEAAVRQMARLRFQIETYAGIKRLLSTWRFGHSLLAIFLVAVIVIHVAVSLLLGYGAGVVGR